MEIELQYLTIVTGVSLNDNELIELNWCIYNITTKEIQYETSNTIRLNKSIEVLSQEDKNILISNKLTNFDLAKPNEIVLKSFYDSIESIKKTNSTNTNSFENIGFIFNSKKISDSLKNAFLNSKDSQYSIVLKCISSNTVDLSSEFCKLYKLDKEVFFNDEKSELVKMLEYFNLKIIHSVKPSSTELNSIARIVNKMNRDNNSFKFIRVEVEADNNKSTLNNSELLDRAVQESIISNNVKADNVLESKMVEETINIFKNNYNRSVFQYVKINVFPNFSNKLPILNLLKKYNVDENDIVKCVDIFGRECGVYIIRILEDYDYNELLSNMNL